MTTDNITEMTHRWAAWKCDIDDSARIERVDFKTVNGGYCETCEYTISGIEIRLRKTHGVEYLTVELEGEVTDLIREILEFDASRASPQA